MDASQTSSISLKDTVDIIKEFFTTLAIIVGGIWSYMLFVKKRQKFPRANISHQISHIPISNNKILLSIRTTISNTGDVLLSLESGINRVQQILPLSGEMLDSINKGKDPVPSGKTEIDWPLIGERNLNWEKGKFEIEPGENDKICCDFIIDKNVQIVSVYSYLKNIKKHCRDIGWGLTTIYNLKEKQEGADKRESIRKGVLNDAD